MRAASGAALAVLMVTALFAGSIWDATAGIPAQRSQHQQMIAAQPQGAAYGQYEQPLSLTPEPRWHDPGELPMPSYADEVRALIDGKARLTEYEMRAVLAAAGWPQLLVEDALAVAWCESKWSPSAIGYAGDYYGLFQLWSGWAVWAGAAADAAAASAVLLSPVENAEIALMVSLRDSVINGYHWTQWECRP